MDVFEKRAEDKILQRFAPLIQNVQKIQQTTMEEQLDSIDPEWRAHEREFVANVRQYPTLAHDLRKLYRLSMPEEHVISRATQEAIKKLEAKAKQGAVGGESTQRHATTAPIQVKSFNDAVAEAKRRLAEAER